MATKLDQSEIVTFQELLMSNVIALDAVTKLLIEKGFFTEAEFFAKLKEKEHYWSQYNKSVACTPNRRLIPLQLLQELCEQLCFGNQEQ